MSEHADTCVAVDSQVASRRAAIVSDYLNGLTAPECAKKHGVSVSLVYYYTYRTGARLPKEVRLARQTRNACIARFGHTSVWPDCPEHLRADYETLGRYYGKKRARAMLEAEA